MPADLYGIPVQSTLDAIRLTGQLEGVILDPVYEGKSMAGPGTTSSCATPTPSTAPARSASGPHLRLGDTTMARVAGGWEVRLSDLPVDRLEYLLDVDGRLGPDPEQPPRRTGTVR